MVESGKLWMVPEKDELATGKKINVTASIDEALMAEIRQFRVAGGTFNISEKVEQGLRRGLEEARLPATMAVVERLRREKTQRLGKDFDLGAHEGMRWAREVGTWVELRHVALEVPAIEVEDGYDQEYGRWIGFADATMRPPEEDYPGPSFIDEDGNAVLDPHRCRRYWAGWLEGVDRVYWEVWDYMEPAAIIGRAESIGLKVGLSRDMAVLIGPLDGINDRDVTLLSDFSAHRTEITQFLVARGVKES